MKDASKAQDRMKAAGIAPVSLPLGDAVSMGKWRADFRDPEGSMIYPDGWQNLIVNTGLDQLLGGGLTGGGPWYIGLTDGTPTVEAGDTLVTHAGWVEVTGYDEVARQAWTAGAVSGQSVDNTASAAVFTITANSTTVGGAFLANSSTKGGTTGILFAAGAFTQADVTLSAGSTITITAQFTQAAA
jgi:hypothetical protein